MSGAQEFPPLFEASPELLARAGQIKLLVSDVDGVLTDGHIYMAGNGEAFKAFNIMDGFGIKALAEAGIAFAVITGRQSEIVAKRMQELGVRWVFQGQGDKLSAFATLKTQLRVGDEQIAHVGDDLPDLPLIRRVGLGVAVANAYPELKAHAHYVTRRAGGQGAVREVCDLLLAGHGQLDTLLNRYRHA
ncbi:MAG: 3-deoxy-manno-octulosonate-8-phosphatase KdsC [Gammaproteobacteria bacterium]|nr:3-deoxy-manno-octulosonate-8-phosphatase KdsC [Gammaproteobacteria bacterium]